MSAKSLDDLYNKYSDDGPEFRGGRDIAFSLKLSYEAKLKLEALSAHVGVKKTPLLGEIAEAAVNDMFDRLENEMDEGIQRGYSEELENYHRSGGM
jgi:predicted DNA-binding protein